MNSKHRKSFSTATFGSGVVLYLLVLLIGLSSSVSGQVTASFKSKADFLRIEKDQYTSDFLLEADAGAYDTLVRLAGSMPETLSFTSEKINEHAYQFSIRFSHPTEPSYVKKTLIFLGIEQLKIGAANYVLPDYDPESDQ